MLVPDARLLIFAKAPVSGHVKTRLIPRLDAETAAQLQRLMTIQVVQTATASEICPVELWCYPDTSHDFFQELQQHYPITLYQQQGKDLGEKMFNAASNALQRSNRTVIIGSDCLQYTPRHLLQAFESLAGPDINAVLTPAQDGGYVLIGMNHVDKQLFEDIAWGSVDVLEQTRKVLRRLGWRWQELPCLQDIDVESDLEGIAAYAPKYPLNSELRSLIHRILTTI